MRLLLQNVKGLTFFGTHGIMKVALILLFIYYEIVLYMKHMTISLIVAYHHKFHHQNKKTNINASIIFIIYHNSCE